MYLPSREVPHVRNFGTVDCTVHGKFCSVSGRGPVPVYPCSSVTVYTQREGTYVLVYSEYCTVDLLVLFRRPVGIDRAPSPLHAISPCAPTRPTPRGRSTHGRAYCNTICLRRCASEPDQRISRFAPSGINSRSPQRPLCRCIAPDEHFSQHGSLTLLYSWRMIWATSTLPMLARQSCARRTSTCYLCTVQF